MSPAITPQANSRSIASWSIAPGHLVRLAGHQTATCYTGKVGTLNGAAG